MAVHGKAVLLTGASGGIGAEVARRLGKSGARLAIASRRTERLDELAGAVEREGGERPVVLPADLGRAGAAAELAERAHDALGDIDVLINNAGASMQGLTWLVGDSREAREVVETNLWAPLHLVAAVAPAMVNRGDGTIVNVGSMARVAPFPHLGIYAASRAALATATEVLAMELRPRGVHVVEVALGPVDTPASRENRALAGADRWLDGRPGVGDPVAAAAVIARAAEGDGPGLVFYPRLLRWVHRFPGLGRRYARRAASHADVLDEAVRVGGSGGDERLHGLRGE
jgi:3-oxoacyl-[acyl-carrier protein] reductase